MAPQISGRGCVNLMSHNLYLVYLFILIRTQPLIDLQIFNFRQPKCKIFNYRQKPAGSCHILPINICHFRFISKLPNDFMKLYDNIQTIMNATQNMSSVNPLKTSQTDFHLRQGDKTAHIHSLWLLTPPINGHLRDSRLFRYFLMAICRLLKVAVKFDLI